MTRAQEKKILFRRAILLLHKEEIPRKKEGTEKIVRDTGGTERRRRFLIQQVPECPTSLGGGRGD